jgi:hypothetical protein
MAGPVHDGLRRWREEMAGSSLWAGYAAGWMLVLGATFGVSHCDLFGLRQAWP